MLHKNLELCLKTLLDILHVQLTKVFHFCCDLGGCWLSLELRKRHLSSHPEFWANHTPEVYYPVFLLHLSLPPCLVLNPHRLYWYSNFNQTLHSNFLNFDSRQFPCQNQEGLGARNKSISLGQNSFHLLSAE